MKWPEIRAGVLVVVIAFGLIDGCPLPTPDDKLPERTSDDHAEEVFQRLELRSAVGRLAERDRELVALRFGADLTARQIGELLDLKTNAVEVALHRALATLRSLLERNESTEIQDRGDAEWTTQPRP